MASDVTGFFRQQKKKSGVTRAAGSKKTPRSKAKGSASCGSDVVQPPALVSHGSFDLLDEFDDKEEVLRQFDMNMAYGPCLGMSRLDRWKRATALGLQPPEEIGRLLRAGKSNPECLWDGRV
ncbi:hypothetical protein F511_05179 [Dorcoceras hygrometricum]|uniref:DNA polymerase delta subunit 4 n=1 Tax=Dorcoceras hygrometricum TaxID=472368 RepID=A0A2Z7C206_9LAMI|nr:hypothetical protein F511_05179 [Dorcoceras hygrometricum]